MEKNIQICRPDGHVEKVYRDNTLREIYWEDNYFKVVSGGLVEMWSYSYLIQIVELT